MRLFHVKDLTKVAAKEFKEYENKADRAFKAGSIDPGKKSAFTLSADEASADFAGERRRPSKKVQIDVSHGLQIGDYVMVDDDKDNPMWREMGIGVIRGLGDRTDTMQVQFESGGDSFTL